MDPRGGGPHLSRGSEKRLFNFLHLRSTWAFAWLLADGVTIALRTAGTGVYCHGLEGPGLFPAFALQHDFAFLNAHHFSLHHVFATDAFARVF